ncbi:MAG TPA: hypothetical protein VFT51_04700 [Bacillales bacterium]|nr:hypothetical protein [Bacillales bacterium]
MPVEDEKAYQLASRYILLMERTEEGFACFESRDPHEMYRALADMISSFIEFGKIQVSVREYFADDEQVLSGIDGFSKVIQQVEDFGGRFTEENLKETLVPAFRQWKALQMTALAPYMSH